MSNTLQFAVFIHRIDMEFNITEELAVLMPMKKTTTGAYLYEEVKVLQSLDNPIQKPPGLVTECHVLLEGTVVCIHLSVM